jgi:hyperosmotically inducible periplasmic protein
MRARLTTAAIAAAVLAVLAIACKQVPASERAAEQARRAGDQAGDALERAGKEVERGAEALERQAKPLLDDATLTAKVKAKLAADPEVTAYAIDVDTLESVVTLSGRVESAAESAEAEKLARNTEGVRTVVNRLAVGNDPIPGTEPAPAASPAR